MFTLTTVIVVGMAALFGAVAGTVIRRWLATLARGAVVAPGWIEVPTALISGAGAYLTGHDGPWPLVLWIGLLGVPLTAVDLKHHRLPDAITLPAIPLTLLFAAVDRGVVGAGDLLRAVLGGLVLGTLFYGIAYLLPRAMGRGDAKLAISIGVALGYLSWTALIVGLFLAFLLGSLIGVVGLLSRRLTLTSSIAFGPALLLGCWLTLAVPQGLRLISRGG